jgi:hypothetical protein
MSAAMRPAPPVRLERLEQAKTIDDVVQNLDQIIDWSMKAQSTIGYFAAAYKRATVAIRQALHDGQFDDGRLVEQFDVAFAQRYFNALNAYFYPDEYEGLMLAWEVAFVGHENAKPTMLQELIAGFNVHICFDLGVAVEEVAANSLDKLEHDFNLVNALLGSQVPGMLDVVEHLSPEVRWIRRVIPDEIRFIRRLLMKFRAAAWRFAIYMALHPDIAKEKRVNQAAWTAALGSWYLQPPPRLTPFPVLVRVIAKRESRDIGDNIRALAGITNSPENLTKALL